LDNNIQVNYGNCGEVAKELVSRLRGRSFSIEYFESNIYPEPPPKRIPGLRLYDEDPIPGFDASLGYHLEADILTILVSPKRKLEWNLNIEEVSVTFCENGRIMIEKTLLNAVFYIMVLSFDDAKS